MARHSCKSSKILMDEENTLQNENSKVEETVNSNNSNISNTFSNLPLYNGNALETKLSESEAKISKLISEIDLLKRKVS